MTPTRRTQGLGLSGSHYVSRACNPQCNDSALMVFLSQRAGSRTQGYVNLKT
jgi:hypothetical protein